MQTISNLILVCDYTYYGFCFVFLVALCKTRVCLPKKKKEDPLERPPSKRFSAYHISKLGGVSFANQSKRIMKRRSEELRRNFLA